MLPADYPWLDASNLQMTDEEYFDIIERKLPKVIAEKEKINKIYRNLLPESIQMGDDFQNWRFMIVIENRQKVLDAIFKAGLFAGTNFPSVSYSSKVFLLLLRKWRRSISSICLMISGSVKHRQERFVM